jgi:hypothetical protein
MDLDLFPTDRLYDGGASIDNMENTTNWPSEQSPADQNRPEASTDPFVQVERYHEALPSLLKDDPFRQALHLAFPRPTVHSVVEGPEGTFDTTFYLAVRQYVYESLRNNPEFV